MLSAMEEAKTIVTTRPLRAEPLDRRLIEGVIGNLACFREAAPNQLGFLASRSWVLAARRGDLLARKGDRLPGLLALAYGSVKLALRGHDREERVLRLVLPGQLFGEAPALLGRDCPYEAHALVDAKIVAIPPASVFSLVERDPRFGRCLLKLLAERELDLLAEVEAATLQRSAQRLGAYLRSLVEPNGSAETMAVRLPVSKTVVAARLGVKKETLSRLLRALESQGVIRMAQRNITILDYERLA